MIRPGLFLAITFSACVAIAGALDADAAQKPAAPAAAPKGGGWSTAETPAGAYDPAYAAYDSGRYEQALKLASEGAAKGEVQAETLLGKTLLGRLWCPPERCKGRGVVHQRCRGR